MATSNNTMTLAIAALVGASACASGTQPQAPRPGSPADVTAGATDTVPLPGEPRAHPPGRVPPPGPYLPGFEAVHYEIAIDIPAHGARFTGETTIHVAVHAPRRNTLRLDLNGLRATGVTVAHGSTAAAVRHRQDDGRLFVPLPAAVREGDTIRVTVVHDGTPDDGLIIRANVHGRHGAFGDNWPDRARFWFPSIDHPSQKATVAWAVRAPDGWQVVANGVRLDAQGRELRGPFLDDAVPPADGVWRWRMQQPIPTYLMVVGATNFATGTVDDCASGGITPRRPDGCVPTGFRVFHEDSANAARIFARAGDMLTFYSDLIAPFPYDRLAHVQSATRFGGMENAGAIFYSEQAIARGTLGEGTVAHEIAHQWFGNAVTPARWADLWLSEGFASYFGPLYFEHADGRDRFRELIDNSRAGYFRSQVTDLPIVDTLAVPENDLLALLNANSYNKGGAVLHMLRGLLGDSAFFNGVRRYYSAHLHGNAVTADLRAALEQASGRELAWFFDQWLYRPGHPIVRVDHMWDADAGEVVVAIQQLQKEVWPAFRMPMQIEFDAGGAVIRRDADVSGRRWEGRFALPARPSSVTIDPDAWILMERR